jgi:hypothetical protein
MPDFTILYDDVQEADWFSSLHPELNSATERPITGSHNQAISQVLSYDRPDIVLVHEDEPILVVEETIEVPSGHNVGQRFARIVAAAELGVPSLYFGPYVAQKHGGATAGPRYVNARLFHALDRLESATGTSVTTINWPIDASYEVRRDSSKDDDVKEYIGTFLDLYSRFGRADISNQLMKSNVYQRMKTERDTFVSNRIQNPQQYDSPPSSVELISRSAFETRFGAGALSTSFKKVVLYKVGMTKIRSDPYTGMALLYRYLYVAAKETALVLWFPSVTTAMWRAAASNSNRKDIRLFRLASDAIAFSDQVMSRDRL